MGLVGEMRRRMRMMEWIRDLFTKEREDATYVQRML